jgi:hypothetical protein
MGQELKTFDLENKVATFGNITAQGFADGDCVTVEWDGEAFTYKKGGDGMGVRSKVYARSGKVRIRVWQTSSMNDQMSAKHELDYKAKNGAGIAPFQLEDVFGATLIHAEAAWITGPPNYPLGPEAGVIEWVLQFHDAEITVGA